MKKNQSLPGQKKYHIVDVTSNGTITIKRDNQVNTSFSNHLPIWTDNHVVYKKWMPWSNYFEVIWNDSKVKVSSIELSILEITNSMKKFKFKILSRTCFPPFIIDDDSVTISKGNAELLPHMLWPKLKSQSNTPL